MANDLTSNSAPRDRPPEPYRGYEEFYREVAPKLLGRARLYGFRGGRGEDLMQATMEIALKKWNVVVRDLGTNERLKYVKRVMVNLAAKKVKRAVRFRELVPGTWSPGETDSVEMSALDRLSGEQILELVERRLPQRQKFVVALLWDGYSISEIADLLQVKRSTISSHLHEARRKLAEGVNGREDGWNDV